MNLINERRKRLKRFANKYGQTEDGLQRFLSLEAILQNVQDDLELVKLGFTGEQETNLDKLYEVLPDLSGEYN